MDKKNRSDGLLHYANLEKPRGPESLLSRNTGEGRLHPVFVAAPSDRHDHTHDAHVAHNAHDAHDINDPGRYGSFQLDPWRPKKVMSFFLSFSGRALFGQGAEPPKN